MKIKDKTKSSVKFKTDKKVKKNMREKKEKLTLKQCFSVFCTHLKNNKTLRKNKINNRKNLNKLKQEKSISKAENIDKKIALTVQPIKHKLVKIKNKFVTFIVNKFGYVDFVVIGLNTTKLLNTFKSNLISQTNIVKNENGVTLRVFGKDFKKVKKILNNYGYKYNYGFKSKIFGFFNFIFKKQAVAFVLLIGVMFYLVSNAFVLKISVNSKQTEIYKFLDKANIKIGTRINDIDTFRLEREITSSLDDISFCDIKIRGNTLIINITDASTNGNTKPQDINQMVISTCDCIISRQLVYSGTATKKFGDIVRKGDVLVANYIQIDEKLQLPIMAVGDIYGFLQTKTTKIIPKINKEKLPTGNFKKVTVLGFNKRFKNIATPYKLYEKEVDERLISNILPLYKRTVTFNEYAYQTVKYDIAKIIDTYVEKTVLDMKNNLKLSAKFSRSWFDIEEREDEFVLTCFIEYEDKISVLSEANNI